MAAPAAPRPPGIELLTRGWPPVVSLRDLARRTGLSEREVRRLHREAGLPCYRIGRRWWRVITQEFEGWWSERPRT